MDALHVHVAFLAEHVVAVVFCAFLIEAAGIPFPSRLILIVAAASRFDLQGLIELGLAATAGAATGDHVPYLAGMLAGPRLLAFYCRITLGSERCVERNPGVLPPLRGRRDPAQPLLGQRALVPPPVDRCLLTLP
jgi:membrane protein DedA with SNARE-associated domain